MIGHRSALEGVQEDDVILRLPAPNESAAVLLEYPQTGILPEKEMRSGDSGHLGVHLHHVDFQLRVGLAQKPGQHPAAQPDHQDMRRLRIPQQGRKTQTGIDEDQLPGTIKVDPALQVESAPSPKPQLPQIFPLKDENIIEGRPAPGQDSQRLGFGGHLRAPEGIKIAVFIPAEQA